MCLVIEQNEVCGAHISLKTGLDTPLMLNKKRRKNVRGISSDVFSLSYYSSTGGSTGSGTGMGLGSGSGEGIGSSSEPGSSGRFEGSGEGSGSRKE